MNERPASAAGRFFALGSTAPDQAGVHRMAERRHEQQDLVDLPVLQWDPALAEVDL